MCAVRVFACQGVVRSAVRFEARAFEFYGLVRTRRYFWEGIFFAQPKAQRSEMFFVCVVFVFLNAPHWQDRTAKAQMFQRMHHLRWVGRAAERCWDATSSVVCVGVGVCVPKCTTSAGSAAQGTTE